MAPARALNFPARRLGTLRPDPRHPPVLTRRYELLLAEADSSETAVQGVVTSLVSAELDERADAFDAAIKDLKEQITRWATPGMLVLPDSSFYIRHPQKLEDADIPKAVNADGHPIHLIVPIAVIDELDRLKETKDNNARWRVGYTLAVIDRLFQNTTKAAQLRAAGLNAIKLAKPIGEEPNPSSNTRRARTQR
jgi:rRNA-processing protein FCF1